MALQPRMCYYHGLRERSPSTSAYSSLPSPLQIYLSPQPTYHSALLFLPFPHPVEFFTIIMSDERCPVAPGWFLPAQAKRPGTELWLTSMCLPRPNLLTFLDLICVFTIWLLSSFVTLQAQNSCTITKKTMQQGLGGVDKQDPAGS